MMRFSKAEALEDVEPAEIRERPWRSLIFERVMELAEWNS
jgi:hypothetical protein